MEYVIWPSYHTVSYLAIILSHDVGWESKNRYKQYWPGSNKIYSKNSSLQKIKHKMPIWFAQNDPAMSSFGYISKRIKRT